MTSALIVTSEGPDAPDLAGDLRASGIDVLGVAGCTDLVQRAIIDAPNLIVCFERTPEPDFFECMAALDATAPHPVAVFTFDADADKIARATASGIHAYVVNGYGQARLRSVIHLAQARFRREQLIRQELADVNQRFAERKLVDRAKGIMMGARQLREDEAYRVLRAAAMASKQRIGQVSQVVIDQARFAEAMNRAGQLRMLSQRLVKLNALACARVRTAETAGLSADSVATVDDILSILGRSLSEATFGDLLAAVVGPWTRLRAALQSPPITDRLPGIDALAAKVLLHAEQLTANLEIVAFATALRVINVAGRQRMLSQRLAKSALLAGLLPDAAAARKEFRSSRMELAQGMTYLNAVPLTNAEIRREMDAAEAVWREFEPALGQDGSPADTDKIAELSEELLGCFDRLTDQFERAMQAMTG